MFVDFRKLGDAHETTADICIIGAGPAGLSLAKEFLHTSTQVILVESGGMELEEQTQSLCEGVSTGIANFRHRDGRARAFGGTSKLWAGQCTRLDEIDFEERPWIPFSGWPFQLSDLIEYYSRAEAFFDIRGEVFDERNYRRFQVASSLHLSKKLRTRFTIFIANTDTGNRAADEIRRSKNITALLHANVTGLEANDAGTKISSVGIQTLDGKKGRIIARAIVLCAGGIENARLLLLPTKNNAHGIGNDRDLVGRFFQEHPNVITAETSTRPSLGALQEQFRLFYGGHKRYFPRLALRPEVQREQQVLNCNAHLVFDYPEGTAVASLQNIYRAVREGRLPSNVVKKCFSLVSNVGDLASAVTRRYVKGKSPLGAVEKVRLQCWLEQAPNASSRVLLSCEKDCLGLPRPVVDWRLTSLEHRTCQLLTQVVSDEFRRLQLGDWISEDWLQDESNWTNRLSDGAHHIGTTRIASSPEHGVVDMNCKVYGVESLYVAGSSVFPTSGWANPTLTIVALAIRLADHLKKELRSGSQLIRVRVPS